VTERLMERENAREGRAITPGNDFTYPTMAKTKLMNINYVS